MPASSQRLPDALAVPDPARLDPARPDHQAILAAHGRALAAGEDGYLDPATGWWSFTATYLWERGTCCDSGCRHCPYVNQRARLAGRGGADAGGGAAPAGS